VEGRQTYFQANRDCPVFEELRGLVRKTFGVAEVLQAGLAGLAGHVQLAFIYGSVAAGGETAGSDVTLCWLASASLWTQLWAHSAKRSGTLEGK